MAYLLNLEKGFIQKLFCALRDRENINNNQQEAMLLQDLTIDTEFKFSNLKRKVNYKNNHYHLIKND